MKNGVGKFAERISNLPQDLIDEILSFIPLREAARTSVLSTNWRLHWTRTHTLELDASFFTSILGYPREDSALAAKFVHIVDDILKSHNGQIQKFVLHIPHKVNIPNLDVIVNRWILNISRCGVQDLTLDLGWKFHKVPSYLFQCTKLKNLSLKGVEHSPYKFREFSFLRSLEMHCESTDGSSLTNMIQNCPMLQRFSLRCGTNDGPFIVNASKLEFLSVRYYYGFHLILKNTPKLSTISIVLWGLPHDEACIKCQDMLGFFRAVPKIENLTVSGDVLDEWTKQDIPGRLPAQLENHSSLTVRLLNLYSDAQVCSLFCLLNGSPKLQTLDVQMHQPYMRHGVDCAYLRSQFKYAKNVWSLKTLKTSRFKAMESDRIFIKKFISSCPVLEKVYVNLNEGITSNQYHNELLVKFDIEKFQAAIGSNKVDVIITRE